MGAQRAAPANVWLMANPVVFNDAHLFVGDGAVWSLPIYRLAGCVEKLEEYSGSARGVLGEC